MDNRINVVLPPENRELIFQAVRNVKNGLLFLVKLSKAERDALLKILEALHACRKNINPAIY